MAQDRDGKPQPLLRKSVRRRARKGKPVIPFETRGRRSTSQRIRDLAEQLRGYASLGESAPKWAELLASGAFLGGMTYFLRPRIEVEYLDSPTPGESWGGRGLSAITIRYPDQNWARNVAVLISVVLTRQADLGGILALGGTALVFTQLIEKTFADQRISAYDLAFGPDSGNVGNVKGKQGTQEVRLNTYARIILPRVFWALFIASLFYMIVRYSTTVGSK